MRRKEPKNHDTVSNGSNVNYANRYQFVQQNYPLGGWTYLAGTPSPMPVGIDQIIARRGIVVVVIHVVAVQHFLLLIMSFRIRCRKREPLFNKVCSPSHNQPWWILSILYRIQILRIDWIRNRINFDTYSHTYSHTIDKEPV